MVGARRCPPRKRKDVSCEVELMVSKTLFSSETAEWETPQELFDQLNKEFHFTLDVCATSENAKCTRYFTQEVNGLSQSWAGEVCWMNPPYGEPEQPCKPKCHKKKCKKRGFHNDRYIPGVCDWVKKAYEESLKGATVVCLLPARTETRWFHGYILGKAEVRFIKGRLKFGGAKHGAPFPSIIVVLGKRRPAGGN
ncbi:hypothetical protein Pmgp_03814 [Pelotomaculum propionicicum]|uniref:DNA N-6-adenine-methyltransferase (Dam) n=1 Tax=Pelotomaculum propionicicum TaxID=258475 RepID=A0A4Y7RB83_9FIRM|nr:hypothetical protein Pmgp_03814 [Pelotomaculum propionicicum]